TAPLIPPGPGAGMIAAPLLRAGDWSIFLSITMKYIAGASLQCNGPPEAKIERKLTVGLEKEISEEFSSALKTEFGVDEKAKIGTEFTAKFGIKTTFKKEEEVIDSITLKAPDSGTVQTEWYQPVLRYRMVNDKTPKVTYVFENGINLIVPHVLVKTEPSC